MLSSEVIKTTHQIQSSCLKRTVEFNLYVPDELMGNETVHLLLLNDGQEADALDMEGMLSDLYTSGKIETLVVAAVKSSQERLQEYGVAGVPDYLNRGSKADLYTQFVKEELLPFIEAQVAVPLTGTRAVAGFSLGGLSAFDLVWNNDQLFDVAGVFSGSFWWRKKDLKQGYQEDKDRIVHQMIRHTAGKPAVRFWLMTGTEDETADRNRNFIIDSIDDTIDVIKELKNKGYHRPDEVFYYEMVGGKHEIGTWAKAMPAFLTWAFGRKPKV
eukprot:gene4706-5493_t